MKVLSAVFLNSFQMPKHISASAFCFFPFYTGLTLLWPFFSAFLNPVLVLVPGYSQVSGGRKDLFSYFESPVSVGSQGKGWGGSTTHRTGLTTLMWPCSTPLLSHIMERFLHLMSPSIGKNKTKNKYLNLVTLNDFWYSTNLVITHSPLPHH